MITRRLFLGSTLGVAAAAATKNLPGNRFHPLDQQDNPHAPEVVITEVKVLNKPLEAPLSVSWHI